MELIYFKQQWKIAPIRFNCGGQKLQNPREAEIYLGGNSVDLYRSGFQSLADVEPKTAIFVATKVAWQWEIARLLRGDFLLKTGSFCGSIETLGTNPGPRGPGIPGTNRGSTGGCFRGAAWQIGWAESNLGAVTVKGVLTTVFPQFYSEKNCLTLCSCTLNKWLSSFYSRPNLNRSKWRIRHVWWLLFTMWGQENLWNPAAIRFYIRV
jgi:hypothetical protein